MDRDIQNIVNRFDIIGVPVTGAPYGEGHINSTFLIETDAGNKYILQKINNHVFKDVDKLMENIFAVTEFLQKEAEDAEKVMTLIKAKDGSNYVQYQDGTYWRLTAFIDGICFQVSEKPEDFYYVGKAFGDFQHLLAKFPAETLHETIPNFHNTVFRYGTFKEVVKADSYDRVKTAKAEIDFVLAREDIAGTLTSLLDNGQLPLRVTHNDTKLNNVLFDRITRKPITILDLDTVMPGLSLYDIGDAIRFGAATSREDETDLSKMEIDLDLYENFVRGYLEACPDLTVKEIEMIPMGAKIIGLEIGMRFLTDYLDGDNYFAIHKDGQNLDRARAQLKLVEDMENKWDRMNEILHKYANI